jgi:hypothetical protein
VLIQRIRHVGEPSFVLDQFQQFQCGEEFDTFRRRIEDSDLCSFRFRILMPKSFSQKRDGSGMFNHMNSVLEIEKALQELPPQERWEVARWLLEDLQEGTISPAKGNGKGNGDSGERTAPLPDYSARRRRIFGSKVLPNMVLASRAEESW